MIFHNAVKRLLATKRGCDRHSSDRVSLICEALALPKKGIALIPVMGQSGKSTVATMLSRALYHQGYRVGCLTTPFSHTMTECIAIDCQPISMDSFASAISRVCDVVTRLCAAQAAPPDMSEEESDALSSEQKTLDALRAQGVGFEPYADELLLCAALLCFHEAGCHMAILEIPSDDRAGAYRLPSVPHVNVITGTEDTDIARRICRMADLRAHETVTAVQGKSVYSMIADSCAKANCRLTMPIRGSFFPIEITAGHIRLQYNTLPFEINSGAFYQALNLLTVVETLRALNRNGFSIDVSGARFHPQFQAAGLTYQFCFLSIAPVVVTDFADSESRLRALAEALSYHKELIGDRITIFTETDHASALTDELLRDTLDKREFTVTEILRCAPEALRPTLKPMSKKLASYGALLIIGSRPFVYEAARILQDVMA